MLRLRSNKDKLNRTPAPGRNEEGTEKKKGQLEHSRDAPPAPSSFEASPSCSIIMALKLELAETRTSLDVSLQTRRDISSALAIVTVERDDLRRTLERARKTMSVLRKSAREAGTEVAELRVQAEMLRGANERCREYANMRDECQRLRMENQGLREQLEQEEQRQLANKPVVEEQQRMIRPFLYSLPSAATSVSARGVFSQPVSASGVNTLPEKGRIGVQHLPVCTNESPAKLTPNGNIGIEREEERSSRPVPRRSLLLNMLPGLSSASSRHALNGHTVSNSSCEEPLVDDEKSKKTGSSEVPNKKIASEKNELRSSSSIFSIGQLKSCPARLQQDEASSPAGGTTGSSRVDKRTRNGRGSIKVLLADQCPHQQPVAEDDGEPRRRRSDSNIDKSVDLDYLYDSHSSFKDAEGGVVVPGGILVPWRHELAEQRRTAGQQQQRDNKQNKMSKNSKSLTLGRHESAAASFGIRKQAWRNKKTHEELLPEPTATDQKRPNGEEEEESQEIAGPNNPASFSARDAAKVMCSADISPAQLLQQPQPLASQEENLLQDEYDSDRQDTLTIGTVDDVERFFSYMMDEDQMEEEDILRDLDTMAGME